MYSGAADLVCPWDWATEFPIKGVAWNQKRHFLNASGTWMERSTTAGSEFEDLGTSLGMKLQVSDARGTLASAVTITENENIVQFEPKDEDNHILNWVTKDRRWMGRKFALVESFVRKRLVVSGPKPVPPACTVEWVKNAGAQRACKTR